MNDNVNHKKIDNNTVNEKEANKNDKLLQSERKSKSLSIYLKKLKWLTILIVLFAVILRIHPELCFKIPYIGFIFHVLITGIIIIVVINNIIE